MTTGIKSAEVAMDSTQLLAADSHLLRGRVHRDPDHPDAFRSVVTVFCNTPSLLYLAPPARLATPTPLLGLFREAAQQADFPGSTFEEVGIQALYDSLNRRFAAVSAGDADRILGWLRFQFSNRDLVEIFWAGGNRLLELREAEGALRRLKWQSNPLFQRLHAERVPLVDRNVEMARHFETPGWYALAYTFHAFAKGRHYAHQLAGGAPYHTHWLRSRALPRRGDPGVSARLLPPREMFPWGSLLDDLFESHAIGRPSPEGLQQGLFELRALTQRFAPTALAAAGAETLADFALTGLERAGWLPSSHAGVRRRLLNIAHTFIESVAGQGFEVGKKTGVLTSGVLAVVREFKAELERATLGLGAKASFPIRLHVFADGLEQPAVKRTVDAYLAGINRRP